VIQNIRAGSGIKYATPDQAHRGLMDRIVAQRRKIFNGIVLTNDKKTRKLTIKNITGKVRAVSLFQKFFHEYCPNCVIWLPSLLS